MAETKKLTRRQGDLLGYIIHFIRSNGYPPTITQMSLATGCDKALVSRRIRALEEHKIVRKDEKNRTNLRVMPGCGADDLVDIPYITPVRREILNVIDSLAEEHKCWPSLYAIAKASGHSEMRVARHVEYLSQHGYTRYDRQSCAVLLLKHPPQIETANSSEVNLCG